MLNKALFLANYLNENLSEKNQNVGILLTKSVEMIISILAILFSGRTYIPLDPK
jgi:acyl-CoA synthetase (AMP-forming)/AMP-acid ligase II